MLDSKSISEDFKGVTDNLHGLGFSAPRILLNRDGYILTKHRHATWRMRTYISGQVHQAVLDKRIAREAGRILGELHVALSKIPHKFRSRPHLHDTRKIARRLEKLMPRLEATDVILAANARIVLAELPNYVLPDGPPCVIHGDPKISNIIFGRDQRARAMIDFDSCNQGSLLFDIGDAFRSWCSLSEDCLDPKFNPTIFRAAWLSYREVAAPLLGPNELRSIEKAIKLITLELAARFINDFLEDSYFGWDPRRFRSRKTHNRARALNQIAYYRDIAAKSQFITTLTQG